MRPLRLLIIMAIAGVSANAVVGSAYAWELFTRCSPAKVLRWDTSADSTVPFDEMAYLLDSDVPFSITSLRSGLSAAFWGYARDTYIAQELYVDTSSQTNYGSRTNYSNSSWWDTDSQEEFWFESTDVYVSGWGTGSFGIFGDNWSCGSTYAWLTGADIALNAEGHGRAEDDSITDCLADPFNYSVESTAIHEVGHAYGLAHNDATLTVMHTGGTGAKCDLTNSYHLLPWPDEIRGLDDVYGGVTSGARNVAGSAYYRPYGDSVTIDVITVLNPNASTTFTFSYMSFYNSVDEWDYELRWIRNGQLPTGSTTYLASSRTVGLSVSNPKIQVTSSSAIPLSASAPSGYTYRLWVRVDQDNSLSEPDEYDNWFPLAITYYKS